MSGHWRKFEIAERLNANNSHSIATCGLFLWPLGEWERAVALTQKAMFLNPHHHLSDVLTLIPDFETRGREIMQRLLYSEENVAMVMAGLSTAGLKIK